MTLIRNTSDFFQDDLPSYAAYDNQRKIASGIDGLKISMRKILYTLLEKYPGTEKIKTDTIANVCAAFTNYLHGAANLGGVCDTMAQSFVGANNYPLIEGNSSGFGTRINPICAASRYTKVALSPIIEAVFNKDDLAIVEKQFFEGTYIEPKFFIPVFPTLFLNGSHGLSTGFSQDIFPRNPNEILDYLRAYLLKKPFKGQLLPWFKNFTGTIKLNTDTNKIECYGVFERQNMTTYSVSELPIGLDYQKYIEILDKLCDDNIIQDYTDKCDTKTDSILFEIKTTREFTKNYNTDQAIFTVLKLVKTLPETLCCIDSNNKVKEYTNVEEILTDFINVRLNYYNIRKNYILEQTKNKLDYSISKYNFCKAIVDGTLIISNTKKTEIIEALDEITTIIKIDNSYNYLLNMPIHSISYDTLKALEADIIELKMTYKKIKETDINTMWLNDLDKFEKILLKY